MRENEVAGAVQLPTMNFYSAEKRKVLLSSATAHLHMFQVRNKVAGEVHMFRMSCHAQKDAALSKANAPLGAFHVTSRVA